MVPSRTVLLTSLAAVTLIGSLVAQHSSVFQTAVPPARSDLERLNLRSEWQTHLPLAGRDDAVGPIQVVDNQQIFVQLRSGLLVAMDANTGARQWARRYPSGYATLHPVAVNSRYVFALNVNKLICLQRYTGLVEFEWEVRPRGIVEGQADGYLPSAGPVVDNTYVYVVTDGTKVMSYLLPPGVQITQQQAGREGGNAADNVTARYVTGSGLARIKDQPFEQSVIPPELLNPGTGGLSDIQRTPSLAVLPTVTPPYTLKGRVLQQTPSLSVVPTLRQPFEFRPSFMQYNQRTPSIAVIPPSIARVHELANLRPPLPGPKPYWSLPYNAPVRLHHQPVMVDPMGGNQIPRLWLTSEGTFVSAISRATGREQVRGRIQDEIVAPMAGPVPLGTDTLIGYLSLADGNVLAVDLLRGTTDGPRLEWRAAVGGRLNHKPLPTADSVFVSGDRVGMAKVDAATGEVLWRSDPSAETVLAVNEEFVYALDQYGDLLVFDRNKPTDPVARRSVPLTKLDLTGFTRPVLNEQTDRIMLASDSGLMICLRDASPKYAQPLRIAPPVRLPAVPKGPVAVPGDPTAPGVPVVQPPPAPPAPAPAPPEPPKK